VVSTGRQVRGLDAHFEGWKSEEMRRSQAPVPILVGDADGVRLGHVVENVHGGGWRAHDPREPTPRKPPPAAARLRSCWCDVSAAR
jgi:hypothetical protein